uniref:TATA element modulatory factor 1 n=1 Tax=Oryzias latipes TaxID=8090 RepID=A0A3P9KN88_ORYLA
MSWFNASHLSSFAKQALTSAQKSIDRVLDIQEGDQWGDTVVMPSDGKELGVFGGWGMTQWEAPAEEKPTAPPPSSGAITTPVTRTVVDESENFFSAFLSPGDVKVSKSPVVSVPPTTSQRRLQKEEKKNIILLQPVSPSTTSTDMPCKTDESEKESDDSAVPAEQNKTGQSDTLSENTMEPDSPTDSSASSSSKEANPDQKECKTEDRQTDTPSPPVSAFSSGTSTTSDIEVLDHESVLSESSVSSRQETGESKAGLHLMQGSFQLLTASTCGDFPQLEDYPKLTESCGSSSDAFERIDSFSMQSLDSRSVSEVNSDDEISASRTLASVTTGPASLTCEKQEEEVMEKGGEEEKCEEQEHPERTREQSLDEMEESGRSATPVNSEQPEELTEMESEAFITVFEPLCKAEAESALPITEEMKSVSTVQILDRLDKRESQLLAVSKEKARLEEECDNLKDEVTNLQEESSTVQSLKDEFTQRIAEAERKAQLACKERDIAKKEIKGLREELSTRLNPSDTMEIIKEKEEQIRGLLEEGEKLSKQQLQHSNIIKKLRVKEKESDSKIMKQQKKIKEQEDELGHLQEILDGKEEVEKQHRENIRRLNAVGEQQEKDLSRLQADVEELQEKNRSLEAALDNSYKELAELHKMNASRVSEAEEAALSRETQAKEQLSLALEKAQEEARIQQEALANQVADLRLALQRAEIQQARKEDYLREEISELQQRLQEAENRNQELSQSVTSATRPLLRQIENLQGTLGVQTASWEKIEKNISDRLVDAQAQLAVAVEKERSATEELLSVKAQLVSLESQNSLLRQEKAKLLAQVEAEKNKREKLEDESNTSLNAHQQKKCLLLSSIHTQPFSSPGLTLHPVRLRENDSFLNVIPYLFHTQDDSLEHSLGTMSMSMSGTNLYEAARLSGGSSIVENLQSQLKLREGEIAQLQLEIANLERSRAVMAEELVRLTNRNDDMEEMVKDIPKLKIQLKDLEQRHNTILQMYGEKAEEAEELRLDLIDVKNMYKTQIDELLFLS